MNELLKKIDYALRKDSLSDAERIASARQLVSQGLSDPAPPSLAPMTDAALKDAAIEYLSHRGENPYRVLRGGSQLWETHVASMKAAFDVVNRLHASPVRSADAGERIHALAIDLTLKGWCANANEINRLTKEAERKLLDFACDEIKRHMDRAAPVPQYAASTVEPVAAYVRKAAIEIADEIDTELNRYLTDDNAGVENADAALRQALWDNKAGIAAYLRKLAAPTTSSEPDAVREALIVAKDYFDTEFSETSDLNHKNYVSRLCDRVDAALAALSRPAHGGWEPMATAPKDGTDILVCDDTKSDGFRQVVFWDEDRIDEWRWSTSDGPTFHQNAFTHWQHLPAPPIPRNDRGSTFDGRMLHEKYDGNGRPRS